MSSAGARRGVRLPEGVVADQVDEQFLASRDGHPDAYVFATRTGRPFLQRNVTRALGTAQREPPRFTPSDSTERSDVPLSDKTFHSFFSLVAGSSRLSLFVVVKHSGNTWAAGIVWTGRRGNC